MLAPQLNNLDETHSSYPPLTTAHAQLRIIYQLRYPQRRTPFVLPSLYLYSIKRAEEMGGVAIKRPGNYHVNVLHKICKYCTGSRMRVM